MILSPEDFEAKLNGSPRPILIDVRLLEDYEACHIERAISNCVFEVAFGERMKAITPDVTTSIIVYGSGDHSHESRTAADKLVRLGYREVYDFQQGLMAAENMAIPLVRGTDPGSIPTPTGNYQIDLDDSHVEWTGRNLLNKHTGKIRLKSGVLIFDEGNLTGGEFLLDMNTMTCDDLAGSPLHDILIDHLKNEDFFDVPHHPTAAITIRQAAPVSGAGQGRPNVQITADLTLRGETHPVEFTATAGLTPEGKPAAQAIFSVDRTRWGAIYGSGKFFQRLAMHLVHDLIDIEVKVVAV